MDRIPKNYERTQSTQISPMEYRLYPWSYSVHCSLSEAAELQTEARATDNETLLHVSGSNLQRQTYEFNVCSKICM